MLRIMAIITLSLIIVTSGFAMSSDAKNDLQTVKRVELEKYLGRWFQIAYYPTRFQPVDCGITTAEYSLKDNGRIRVINTCWGDEYGGEYQDRAKGTAWPVDDSNTKLKVRFFWPFAGDYWVIDLGEDYEYAVVGEPSREYLWILCRELTMDDELYDAILRRLEEKGYDTGRLVYTGVRSPLGDGQGR